MPARREQLRADKARLERTVADLGVTPACVKPQTLHPVHREKLRADKARLERTVADLGVELAFMADKLRARDAEALGAQQELDLVHARLGKAGVDFVRARLYKPGPRVLGSNSSARATRWRWARSRTWTWCMCAWPRRAWTMCAPACAASGLGVMVEPRD